MSNNGYREPMLDTRSVGTRRNSCWELRATQDMQMGAPGSEGNELEISVEWCDPVSNPHRPANWDHYGVTPGSGVTDIGLDHRTFAILGAHLTQCPSELGRLGPPRVCDQAGNDLRVDEVHEGRDCRIEGQIDPDEVVNEEALGLPRHGKASESEESTFHTAIVQATGPHGQGRRSSHFAISIPRTEDSGCGHAPVLNSLA